MTVPVPSISCCVLNHHNLFYQIHNALAFNWNMCCHLALCLQLLPFHCKIFSYLIVVVHSFGIKNKLNWILNWGLFSLHKKLNTKEASVATRAQCYKIVWVRYLTNVQIKPVFAPLNPLQPSPMFASKTRQYPSEAPNRCSTLK